MVQATRHGRSFLGGVSQGAFDESQRVHEGRLFLIKVNGIIRTQNRAIHLADMTHVQLLFLFYYCLLIDALRFLYNTGVMF